MVNRSVVGHESLMSCDHYGAHVAAVACTGSIYASDGIAVVSVVCCMSRLVAAICFNMLTLGRSSAHRMIRARLWQYKVRATVWRQWYPGPCGRASGLGC